MLYLAEVQKQKGGLLSGGGKTELKLIACQRNDQNWTPVSDEMIVAEEASKLNDGALVLVELSPNRQVQRIQEAGRPLVNILQNFSRQVEKFKVKEEEIDQWKQSLMIQVQELNRREMDMEARFEQVKQIEEDFHRLEEQKKEAEQAKSEMQRLRAEVERNRQDLEGAWEHLRGEQRRLEELARSSPQGEVLNDEQCHELRELLNHLSSGAVPTETLQANLNVAWELLEKQQGNLNQNWQQLDIQRHLATQKQEEVERMGQTLRDTQHLYQQLQSSLEQQNSDLQINTSLRSSKQDCIRIITEQLKAEEDLYQQLQCLANPNKASNPQIDVEALEKISLEELQKIVHDLQENLGNHSSFVQDQEQELKYKQQTIDELKSKLQSASGDERTHLESELAEEQDLYQMLNETLVGQRRNLLERTRLLKQHQAILQRRSGQSETSDPGDSGVDLHPLLVQIENQKQQKTSELGKLEQEIKEIDGVIEKIQSLISSQSQELEVKKQEIAIIEENLVTMRISATEHSTKVNFYQEILQPIQDNLDSLQAQLQGLTESMLQIQELTNNQEQTINKIRQALQGLIQQPELLAS
ncbi:hypothetical protein B6N60_01610 [Richelia sinica FACHB-800]|uniref:Uncharacterized protein n=1 Tax=Richelia sinica FACHB-800 TaxID=1357546 RepID=A0A975T657_9NOST|nr:pilus motility taxis protein HmpF [Richelia sinica]MBD2666369.1 hypothetical protein [Richelia sinica FACHB-800]QXE22923.1 hypothetical protein B6N60_01610 [Richelia sinica FACHB-800]